MKRNETVPNDLPGDLHDLTLHSRHYYKTLPIGNNSSCSESKANKPKNFNIVA